MGRVVAGIRAESRSGRAKLIALIRRTSWQLDRDSKFGGQVFCFIHKISFSSYGAILSLTHWRAVLKPSFVES